MKKADDELIQKHFNRFLNQVDFLDLRFPGLVSQWNKEKNNLEGVDIRTHSANVKTTKAWWKCLSCGYDYKLSISKKNKENSSDCPFCLYCETSNYKKIIKLWHVEKNGKLNYIPKLTDTYWFVFPDCEHEVNTSVSKVISNDLCSECISIKNKQTTLEQAAQRAALKDFSLKKSSIIERKLYYFLHLIFEGNVISGHLIKHLSSKSHIEIDVYIQRLNVGFEYDGAYFHKDKAEKDRLKNDRLNELNIKIIRIREEGLDKISPDDIVFNCINPQRKYDVNLLIHEVIIFLEKSFELLPKEKQTIQNIKEFGNLNDYIIPQDFKIYPLYKDSIANKYPHLESDWNSELNISFNIPFTLKNITPKSHKLSTKAAWSCNKCGFTWIDSINRRVHGYGCLNCNPQHAHNKKNEVIDVGITNDIYDILFDIDKLQVNFNDVKQHSINFLTENSQKKNGLLARNAAINMEKISKDLVTKLFFQQKFLKTGIALELKKYEDANVFNSSALIVTNQNSIHKLKLDYELFVPQIYFKGEWYIDFDTISFLTKMPHTTLFKKLSYMPEIKALDSKLTGLKKLYKVEEVIFYFGLEDNVLVNLKNIKPKYTLYSQGLNFFQLYWNGQWYVDFKTLCEINNIPSTTTKKKLDRISYSVKLFHKNKIYYTTDFACNFLEIVAQITKKDTVDLSTINESITETKH